MNVWLNGMVGTSSNGLEPKLPEKKLYSMKLGTSETSTNNETWRLCRTSSSYGQLL
jgi:hypothetical protein